MQDYQLYLESGPKRRKTLARVVNLVGCVDQFPTTDDAIARMPVTIRAFLGFLQRHGDDVDAGQPFTATVAVEDLHGGFLGTASFEADLALIERAECEVLLRRLEWIRGATLAAVDPLDADELEAKPPAGRPVGRIISHILGADYSYVTTTGLRIPGLHALSASADSGAGDPRTIIREAFALIGERLRAMTDEERATVRERSTGPWTVRRMYRSLLEHNWEHYQEIARRLGRPV